MYLVQFVSPREHVGCSPDRLSNDNDMVAELQADPGVDVESHSNFHERRLYPLLHSLGTGFDLLERNPGRIGISLWALFR
jgi:hypothetical protein